MVLPSDPHAVSSSSPQPPADRAISRTNVLGVGVSAVDIPMACDAVARWIERRHRTYVCVTGVHGVIECQSDPALRGIHNRAGMVTPDGMPLVWLSRMAGHRHVSRVYGPDLMLAVCRRSVESGWRHFLYGGADGVAERLADRLADQFPGLRVVGSYTPPFRSLTDDETREIRHSIDRSEADIVWVGISTPKQERWMADNVGRVNAPVLFGVGAAFDFHAGLKRQAPHWMQSSGLEWLFRLLTEPRRLWKRYLRNNPMFIALVTAQALGLRRWTLECENPTASGTAADP